MALPTRDLGKMRHLVKLYVPARASDGGGGTKKSEVELAVVKASIKPASSREVFQASKLELVITHVITLRYVERYEKAGLFKEGRITHMHKNFRVCHGFNADMQHRFITLWADEGGAGNG